MRLVAALLLVAGLSACGGQERDAGTIAGPGRAPEVVAAVEAGRTSGEADVATLAGGTRARAPRQILFGDLHVHTTYSTDAFFFSLPITGGEGAHPPADACDFARYCSGLDFFALTDHAVSLTPEQWAAEKESLRQCQARAGDPGDPDLVALAGFEWTQVGPTPETHWGHKNVIFRELADEALPARPINSLSDELATAARDARDRIGVGTAILTLVDPLGWREYADFRWYLDRLTSLPRCERGVDTRELPPDCVENAPEPTVLFEKLEQWGFDSLVIPHGTTWGIYSPPGTQLDKQLSREQHDPGRQSLIEVMSGHGNSEEYRSYRAVFPGPDGAPLCPEPREDFLPCCWRAGELMRARCGDRPAAECEALVEDAKRYALEAGIAPHLVFPDTRAEDWLDCDECRDCFKPAHGYRPAGSAQYALALSRPDPADPDGKPLRFRWSFIASSDNHTARPGTGYKQFARRGVMTDATGARSAFYDRLLRWSQERRHRDWDPSRPNRLEDVGARFIGADAERVTSFLYPGGLAAVHAEGRSREAVWSALASGQVYGTSGPRILLWFDLLNGPAGAASMGSRVSLAEAPRFEVRAVGAFVQQPGCPQESLSALSPERLEQLCRGECDHPSDVRHPIGAIEVVRIRPQRTPDEPLDDLIEDPWRRFPCEPDPGGCVARFEDPDFAAAGRDAVYYVRALQEPTPAVNGANLRTEFDAEANALRTRPCYGDFRTSPDDDCLAPVQERAWSSPIFVDRAR